MDYRCILYLEKSVFSVHFRLATSYARSSQKTSANNRRAYRLFERASTHVCLLAATISVLPRLQVNTLESFTDTLPQEIGKEEQATRESSFVLLQLVSALKCLQARGVEEMPRSLDNVVLCREDKDAYHRLYLFQG